MIFIQIQLYINWLHSQEAQLLHYIIKVIPEMLKTQIDVFGG